MPPQAKPLPEYYTVNNNSTITCNICMETIQKDSHRAHSRSKKHVENDEQQKSNAAFNMRNELNAASTPQAESQTDLAKTVSTFQPIIVPSVQTMPYDNEGPFDDDPWDDYQDHGVHFVPMIESKGRDIMQELAEFEYMDPEASGKLLGWRSEHDPSGEEEDATLTNTAREALLEELGDEDDDADALGIVVDRNGEWWPYLNKMLFLLDTIDNLPRLRLSDSHMKLMLWMLKEAGCRNVPTFSALRRMQSKLREHGAVRTKSYKSSLGNLFYMSSIEDIIAKDLANPMVRKHMRFYPEEPADGVVSEVWHGVKWRRDLKVNHLTPMCVHPHLGKHFYVQEVAEHMDGRLVIPVRWIVRSNVLHADAHVLIPTDKGLVPDLSCVVSVRAADLLHTLPELLETRPEPYDEAAGSWWTINPLREKANGVPLYTVLVDIWGDDVSGNTSKSYNKHDNMYLANRCLNRRLLQQEFHVHFLSTSQHATIPEQWSAVKEQVAESQANPLPAFDCLDPNNPKHILFQIGILAAPADNPMQSLECGHIGMKGNFFCRKCKVGGAGQYKISTDGFKELMKPGVARSSEETRENIQRQLDLAALGVMAHVRDAQTNTGTKCSVAEVWIERLVERARETKKQTPGISADELSELGEAWLHSQPGDKMTGSLLVPGFDINKSTPVEILHTVLLGVVKYCWHLTHTAWSAVEKLVFARRLAAVNIDGLTLPPIQAAYFIQYAGSLIGRQFKALMQTASFCLFDDLVTQPVLNIWKAIGVLGSLLWVPEIADMERYKRDLQQAIDNVVDSFAMHDPDRIIQKGKIHILTHAIEDIEAYGPLVGSATEIFECWNFIFRMCSILSNGLAASRDISQRLSGMEGYKQRATGGFWKDPDTGKPVRASAKARQFLFSNKTLQKHLGWSESKDITPGSVKLALMKKETKPRRWTETQASRADRDSVLSKAPTITEWKAGLYVVSVSGDVCKVDSWVFARMDDEVVIGRITEIVQSDYGSIVTLRRYSLDPIRDPSNGMPYLRPFEPLVIATAAEKIDFIFNAQHDCVNGKCNATGKRLRKQERQETSVEEVYWEHTDFDGYFLNIHALHNAHHLRSAVPAELISPQPLLNSRERNAEHDRLSATLRTAAESRKAAKKKQLAAAQGAAEAETSAAASKKTRSAVTNPTSKQAVTNELRPKKKRKRVDRQVVDEDGDGDDYDESMDVDNDAEAGLLARMKATSKDTREERARRGRTVIQ